MSVIKLDLIPVNKWTRPALKLQAVKKIVLHWTANYGASAENHVKYFGTTLPKINAELEKQGKKCTFASAHVFVDPIGAIQILPFNEVGYHANENSKYENGKPYRGVEELKPNANKLSIGVEMCVEKDGTISEKTIENTALVMVELCKQFKLTEKDIVRHFDVTGKSCPLPFIKTDEGEKRFVDFKAKVKTILNPPVPKPAPAPVKPKPVIPPLTRTLKNGMSGNDVKQLQVKLNSVLGLKLVTDGKFGAKTESAVKVFQKQKGLVIDGLVGKLTWTKLFS